jgi:glucose/arabinose dehydrogenase
VYRYKLDDKKLVPLGEAELVVSGFPEQNQHRTKSITFDGDSNLYVNVGAPSNACMERTRTFGSPGMDPCSELERQAGIWQFNANKLNQDQMGDGIRYATGIRNAVALTWNTAVNALYVVQHGRDQLSQFFPELYSEQENAALPAEELFRVNPDDDFGWPYCYYDHIQEKKVLAPEYGGDGEITGRCDKKKKPEIAFPGHLAPNDILFYTGNQFPKQYTHGAFIAFHGSWNRAPLEQKGYYVVFVPFIDGTPSGTWEVFADGFAGVDVVRSPGDAKYRPCGLAQGPDGSLYVCDSRQGKVWRIVYEG